MNENTNKRKERIKTILIIFLVLLLILTFFSNTIQNYSLPIVAAQYAGYGTITESVRCSGVVTANQNYEVIAEGSRVVESVEVKPGDKVREGDVLFVLEGTDSSESVEAAEAAIADAELNYQKALLTAVPDYAAQNQEIANAREDLQSAINALNEARSAGNTGISDSAYASAVANAAAYSAKVSELTTAISMLDSGSTGSVPSAYREEITKASDALGTADAALTDAQTKYDIIAAGIPTSSAAQAEIIAGLERTANEAQTAYIRAKEDYEASSGDITLKRAMEDAEQAMLYAQQDVENAKLTLTEIQKKEQELQQAQTALEAANTAKTDAQRAYDNAVSKARGRMESDLNSANASLSKANATISAYESQGGTDISALEAQVKQQERALQSLLISLAETKKNDALTQELSSLDLQSQQKAIDKMKAELEELKKNSGTLTVVSKHAGIVSALNFVTGDTVMDGDILANINLTDSGYTVECIVTANQASKVAVGAEADVTNGYGYGIKAQLTDIRTDTQNPTGSDKILTFSVKGSVTVGQSLSLSITCSNENYDCVVPTSAVMEDKDGKFVMIVTAKNTPLGNRYYANRVSVEVLAADEISSAVSGDIQSSDFVITNSEKPLENGMQIRMED